MREFACDEDGDESAQLCAWFCINCLSADFVLGATRYVLGPDPANSVVVGSGPGAVGSSETSVLGALHGVTRSSLCELSACSPLAFSYF